MSRWKKIQLNLSTPQISLYNLSLSTKTMKPFINRQTHKVSNKRYNLSSPRNQPQQSSLNKFECARCLCFFSKLFGPYCFSCFHHIKESVYNCTINDEEYCDIDRSKSSTRSSSRSSSPSSSSLHRYTSRNGSTSPYRTPQPSRSSSRGRSRHSTKSFVRRPSSKSIRRDHQLQKIQAMQYTSVLSAFFPRHESLERPYYRPLSPITRQIFDEHVFYPSSNPNRFQDVLSTNRCLRCYSSNHEGKSCPVFDYPTPRLCPFCRFLYHDEQDCIYKDEHIYDSDLSDQSSTLPL